MASRPGENERLFTPGKSILHGVLVAFFYVWWDFFGIWLAPLLLYVASLLAPVSVGRWDFSTRMQVRSVIIIYFSMFSLPLSLAWCVLRGGWFATTCLAVYVSWYTFLDDAPKCGGRFCPTLRQRAFWRHVAAYFPMRLTRTEELDPSRHYIFGYHPHGIISVGAICNFATEATGFSELFPGIDLRVLTLAMNFRIPFFREYLLGLGVNDVSQRSCLRNLSRAPGSSVMIVVGGARESLETKPGHADLVLEGRKGFVKMALRTGASLVPVFSFGENDVFGVYHNRSLAQFQLRMQKKMGFAIPLFFGRALTGGLLHRLFGLNVGMMPLRVPVHAIVGRPVHVEKIDQPTQEQIDDAHARYMEELKRIYSEWKESYEKERAEVLGHCDEERRKILESGTFALEPQCDLSVVE